MNIRLIFGHPSQAPGILPCVLKNVKFGIFSAGFCQVLALIVLSLLIAGLLKPRAILAIWQGSLKPSAYAFFATFVQYLVDWLSALSLQIKCTAIETTKQIYWCVLMHNAQRSCIASMLQWQLQPQVKKCTLMLRKPRDWDTYINLDYIILHLSVRDPMPNWEWQAQQDNKNMSNILKPGPISILRLATCDEMCQGTRKVHLLMVGLAFQCRACARRGSNILDRPHVNGFLHMMKAIRNSHQCSGLKIQNWSNS